MSITQVYAPTSMSSEEELDNFYDDLLHKNYVTRQITIQDHHVGL